MREMSLACLWLAVGKMLVELGLQASQLSLQNSKALHAPLHKLEPMPMLPSRPKSCALKALIPYKHKPSRTIDPGCSTSLGVDKWILATETPGGHWPRVQHGGSLELVAGRGAGRLAGAGGERLGLIHF
jgi:hypothetical protein